MIKLGPAGIGGFSECEKFLKNYNKVNIQAAEIPFTYQIWMSNEQAKIIRKYSEKYNIDLSIHAPYYINLNSAEKEKIQASKNRILRTCERAHHLGANSVVFHPGFYGKMNKKDAYNIIKNNIIELQDKLKENKWNVKLCPETMGKINVFGTLEEIFDLVKETKTGFCIDFAHLVARSNGKVTYNEVCKELKKFDHIHAHFSGINYGEKGEKNHEITKEEEIKKLGVALKENKINNITIINESPDPINDVIKTINIFKKMGII